MKISTKGRYGLRAMVDLAVYSATEHVSLNSIAERQSISVNYLEHVFAALRKGGLIKSVKGSQGGYLLSKPAEEITVGDILRVLEGSLAVVEDIPSADGVREGGCNDTEGCIQRRVWHPMNELLNKLADSIDLKALAEEYEQERKKDNHMFYI